MKILEAAKWTRAFMNDLPDSSFIWIEPGGKKDSEGKTVPRSKRHLPYKDASGKIDLPHLRNAIARLGQGKPFVMPATTRTRVKARLQNILARMSSEYRERKEETAESLKPIVVSYTTGFKLETLEAEGKKTLILKGKLMDDSINKNNWGMVSEDLKNVAKQITGSAIKIQHSHNDWDIVGTGIKGEVKGNVILYEDKITDNDAISKFESGTWNAQNMGISPKIRFDNIVCSICGQDARVNHEHHMGQTYKDEVCKYIGKGAHLVEQSLTSEPAYKPQAGTIDNVAFCASMDKFIVNKKEEDSMNNENKDQLDAVILEKDNVIDELKSEIVEKDKKIKEFEASNVELENKHKELEEKYKETSEKLDKFVAEKRAAELEKRLTDKELIVNILGQKLTEKEFKAELEKIDKIQEQAKSNIGKGTLPAEGTNDYATAETKIGEEMFGSVYKDLVGEKEGSK